LTSGAPWLPIAGLKRNTKVPKGQGDRGDVKR
jgi:hypothetical protein